VTVSLGINPGTNLIHASGSAGNPILELVDHNTPALLPPIVNPGPKSVSAMTYDDGIGKVFAADLANNLSLIDPVTGTQQIVGTPGALPTNVKALALVPGAHELIAGLITEGNLYSINPVTAAPTLLGMLTIPKDEVVDLSGMAVDPTSGQIFGIAQLLLEDVNDRALVIVDPFGLTVTIVGFMGDKYSGLAFRPDGSLLAVSGDGSQIPESLFTVDKKSGIPTLLLPLGNGDSGESIATIPAQLHGTVTKNTIGGIATFDDLFVTAPAAGYSLHATATGLGPADGRPFAGTAPDLSGVVQFTSSGQTVSEGVGTVTVTLTLDPPQQHEVVAWFFVNGTATGAGLPHADTDLKTFVDTPLTFAPGQTTANIVFHVIDDPNPEPTETVIITIKRVALGQVGAQSVHTVSILDND
jgi:hypothetical protein